MGLGCKGLGCFCNDLGNCYFWHIPQQYLAGFFTIFSVIVSCIFIESELDACFSAN
jgi:hypothetical protein